ASLQGPFSFHRRPSRLGSRRRPAQRLGRLLLALVGGADTLHGPAARLHLRMDAARARPARKAAAASNARRVGRSGPKDAAICAVGTALFTFRARRLPRLDTPTATTCERET